MVVKDDDFHGIESVEHHQNKSKKELGHILIHGQTFDNIFLIITCRFSRWPPNQKRSPLFAKSPQKKNNKTPAILVVILVDRVSWTKWRLLLLHFCSRDRTCNPVRPWWLRSSPWVGLSVGRGFQIELSCCQFCGCVSDSNYKMTCRILEFTTTNTPMIFIIQFNNSFSKNPQANNSSLGKFPLPLNSLRKNRHRGMYNKKHGEKFHNSPMKHWKINPLPWKFTKNGSCKCLWKRKPGKHLENNIAIFSSSKVFCFEKDENLKLSPTIEDPSPSIWKLCSHASCEDT